MPSWLVSSKARRQTAVLFGPSVGNGVGGGSVAVTDLDAGSNTVTATTPASAEDVENVLIVITG